MLKKLTKLITNNFGLKLMSLAFAGILWLVVVNIDDPSTTKPFTISVAVENGDAITSQGKYYEIADGGNTVTFQVTANRSVFKALSSSDFKAVADMSKIEDWQRVPIEITATRYTSSVKISSKTQYLEVNVEDLQKKQLVISAGYTGTPADNCAVGNVTIQGSNVLKVSGPASVVSTIASAKATVNVDGMSTTINDSIVPVLYDENGNEVDTTKLTMNIDAVNIRAEIQDIKQVNVSAMVSGTPRDGYVDTDVSYSPQTVAVKGQAAALNTVNEIQIPDGIVDINDATEDVVQTVDISSYLPEGITLANDEEKKIVVTVKIEQIVNKTYAVPTSNLTILNIPEKYKVDFKNDTVNVSIRGLTSDLGKLSADMIHGTVDAAGITDGDRALLVTLELDENMYTVTGTPNAMVTATGEAEEDGGAADDKTDAGGNNDATEHDTESVSDKKDESTSDTTDKDKKTDTASGKKNTTTDSKE